MHFNHTNDFHTTAGMMYSRREQNCLAHPEQMTQEIFEQCLDTCAAACDAEEYMRLCDLFPHFAQVYRNHVDRLMAEIEQIRRQNNV